MRHVVIVVIVIVVVVVVTAVVVVDCFVDVGSSNATFLTISKSDKNLPDSSVSRLFDVSSSKSNKSRFYRV